MGGKLRQVSEETSGRCGEIFGGLCKEKSQFTPCQMMWCGKSTRIMCLPKYGNCLGGGIGRRVLKEGMR